MTKVLNKHFHDFADFAAEIAPAHAGELQIEQDEVMIPFFESDQPVLAFGNSVYPLAGSGG